LPFPWVIKNIGDVRTGAITMPGTMIVGSGFFIAFFDKCPMTYNTTGTLGPGESCEFLNQWEPSQPGHQSARYNAIANPGGTAFIDMSGDAVP
jgi:hypothetical protein